EPGVDTLVHGKDEARGGPSTTTALEGEAADVPLVSIVLSNYNYGRFVDQAIESALAQTYPRVEVVVVDDGSTDDSREVIGRYEGIVSIFKPNSGQMSAINAGFAACHGAAICFFESDDVLAP